MNNIEISGITTSIISEMGNFYLLMRPLDEKTNKYSKDEIRLLIRDEFIKKQVTRTFVRGYKLYVKGQLVFYKDQTYPLVKFVEMFDHQLREEVAVEYRRVKSKIEIPIIPVEEML